MFRIILVRSLKHSSVPGALFLILLIFLYSPVSATEIISSEQHHKANEGFKTVTARTAGDLTLNIWIDEIEGSVFKAISQLKANRSYLLMIALSRFSQENRKTSSIGSVEIDLDESDWLQVNEWIKDGSRKKAYLPASLEVSNDGQDKAKSYDGTVIINLEKAKTWKKGEEVGFEQANDSFFNAFLKLEETNFLLGRGAIQFTTGSKEGVVSLTLSIASPDAPIKWSTNIEVCVPPEVGAADWCEPFPREGTTLSAHAPDSISPESSAKNHLVEIFYATDRKTASKPPRHYTTEQTESLDLGSCLVSIPGDHRMGYLEQPTFWRLEFHDNPDKHIVLRDVIPVAHHQFYSDVDDRVGTSGKMEAFVFIHGFNVSFEEAAKRTAQIYYDLEFNGAPILYSWASNERVNPLSYIQDGTRVKNTIPQLKKFLTELAHKTKAKTIHLIGHSMGNQALTEAMKDIVLETKEPLPAVWNIVMAAPDIDAKVFENLIPFIGRGAQRLTLYASSNDEALKFSKRMNGYQRAGDLYNDLIVIKGLDTIDASGVDTSLTGHSFYAENRSIISDIYYLFKDGKPPTERFGLVSAQFKGLTYYKFKP